MGERKVAGFLEIKEQRARHVSNSGEAKHIFTFNIYEIVTKTRRQSVLSFFTKQLNE